MNDLFDELKSQRRDKKTNSQYFDFCHYPEKYSW